MNHSPKILPECYGDTLLIEMLGYRKPNHQTSGIGQVIKVMQEKLKGHLALGIVDNDKKITPKYFEEFESVKEENSLILKKHPKQNHHLILLNPALEKFLLCGAKNCGVKQSEIPYSEKDLRRLMKSQRVGSNKEIRKFIQKVITKKSPETETLKLWIENIFEDAY